MGFDYSKLNKLEKDELYEDVYYYKKNEEIQKEQEQKRKSRIKEQINNINSNFSKENLQTVSLPTASNRYGYRQNNLETNQNKNTISNIGVSKQTIKDTSGFVKSSNAFDDGYQFGDVSKTVGSTLANAGASFVEGIGRIGEGASDIGTHVAAQIVDWAGNKDWANRIRQTAMEDRNKELFDNIQKDLRPNSVLGDKSEETLASMGYSTGLMAFEMNPLTSKIGTGLMFSTASAGGLNESYSKEGVTNTQAWIRGLGQGAIETAVERASGLFAPVGSWDKSLSNAVSSRISSGLGKLLVRTGVQGLAEGSEEIASYTLNKIFDKAIDKVSNGRGATFSEKWNWEEVGEQFGIAFLSASLMGMGSSAYEVGQIVNNDKLNLTQAINEAGLRTDVKAQAELLNEDIEDIKKELKKNPSNTELTSELKSKYAQMNELVTNNVFMQEKTDIKEDEAQLRLQEAQDIIDNVNKQENNTTNLQTQQTIQQNKTAQNQTSGQLNDILNNKELPMQSYQYEKSDNVKINNLRQDANKYFNNSEKARNYVKMLEKIITDKNIDIRLDANLKTSDGRIANGSYSNGVITINPNSSRAGEFIAVHELTHAIGTEKMINMIQNYRKSNAEFNSVVENILQNYKSTEMNEEALADVSGQLFGTQEFINNIAQNSPNIFQNIYSEIKYLWHQFRGYKNQNQFVEDLYYKWTQAYNSNKQFNNTNNYHISENFSNEIDKALNNQLQSNTQVKARDYTPKILVENGVENLPMLITQKHIKSIIYTLQEAEKLRLPTKNINYHGLGKDLLIKAIDNLDTPQAIYKTNENNYLVVTEFKDNSGKEIIVPIQINGKGRYNDVFIDENQIQSVYGRNNLHTYINKNNFEQIYKKNKELDFNEGIQYSNVANSSINNSIPSSNKDVNTTRYSIV